MGFEDANWKGGKNPLSWNIPSIAGRIAGQYFTEDWGNDRVGPGGNSTESDADAIEKEAPLEYIKKTPRGYYKRLLQNAQLALINLCGAGVESPGPIALGNKRFYSREEYCVDPERAFTNAAAFAKKAWLSGYSLICPVQSTSQFPPDVALSAMVAKGEEANEFFSFGLSSAQKALLVPLIKIYKIEYPIDEETGRIKPNSIPKSEVEIQFDSYTSDGDIKQMLTTHFGKMHATGIESFEWALKGINPGEVDNNIEASLKIYFNNVSSLFLDNLRQSQSGAGVENRASFLDLIVFAPSFRDDGSTSPDPTVCNDRGYEGRFFEIRVDIGWQVPPNSAGLFQAAEIDAIKKANVSLFLQLTDHEFDFREDGSATLSVNYRARSALIDERFDLLGLAAPGSEIADFKKNEIADTVRQMEQHTRDAQASGRKHVTEEHQDLINTLAEQEEKLAGMLRESYSDIVAELLHKHVYSAVVPLHLLAPPDPSSKTPDADAKSALKDKDDVPGSAGGLQSGGSVARQLSRASGSAGVDNPALEAVVVAYNTAAKDTQVYGPHPLQGAQGKEAISIVGATADETIAYMETDEFSKLRPAVRARGSYSVGGQSGAGSVDEATGIHTGGHWVQYFYLGDILEIFLAKKSVIDSVGLRQKAFVTTDIEFVNSRLVLDAVRKGGGTLPAGALSCGFRGLPQSKRGRFMSVVNLANIPISVELFLDFLKRKIIATQRTTYYIEDFLQDLNNEFVKPIFLQLGLSKPNHGPISCVTNTTVDLNCRLLGGDYRGYPNWDNYTGATGQSARGNTQTNEGTAVWDDEHFMSDLLTIEALRRGKEAAAASGAGALGELVAAGMPGGGEGAPGDLTAAGVRGALEPDGETPQSFSLSNGRVFERELETTEAAAGRLAEKAKEQWVTTVNLSAAVNRLTIASEADRAAAAALLLSGDYDVGDPDNQIVLDMALVAQAEATVGSSGASVQEMMATLGLMNELSVNLLSLAGASIAAVQEQRAARGWAPKWGNTVISNVEGYMYGAGTHRSPKRAAAPASGKRSLVFPEPARGQRATCEIKIISFQNYFGSHLGDYDDNLQKGIPNFVVGLDRGVVKGINFERVDQPHLRESRVSKTRSASSEQLRELYNVTLKLYGNTLLKPGQIIYVEPNQLIFGRPTQKSSISRILGLGGYHLVIDVANEISRDGWETTVKALHVAMPAPIGPHFRYAMRKQQTPTLGIERRRRNEKKRQEDQARQDRQDAANLSRGVIDLRPPKKKKDSVSGPLDDRTA